MVTVCEASPAAIAQWADLMRELDRWGAEGRVAGLWWRDDDAAAPCERLDRLLTIAATAPVALAVIPASAASELATWLDDDDARSGRSAPVGVLQHGWRHIDHASRAAMNRVAAKKSEFPVERPGQSVAADLAAGRETLRTLFGGRALGVLAPPWNRFDDRFLPLLAGCGIGAISQVKPRAAAWPAPGVFAANVHVDLVAWKAGRGFIGEAAALGGLVGHLRARRGGEADRDEPTGILTHHLVQDRATDQFLIQLTALILAHPAARWLDAGEVFAPGIGEPGIAAPEIAASGIES